MALFKLFGSESVLPKRRRGYEAWHAAAPRINPQERNFPLFYGTPEPPPQEINIVPANNTTTMNLQECEIPEIKTLAPEIVKWMKYMTIYQPNPGAPRSIDCNPTVPEDAAKNILGSRNFSIFSEPTGNCQVWCMSYFRTLLSNKMPREQFWAAIYKSAQATGKLLLMVDINEDYTDRLEALWPKKRIIGRFPYKSTNGSSMVMYLLDLRRLVFNDNGYLYLLYL